MNLSRRNLAPQRHTAKQTAVTECQGSGGPMSRLQIPTASMETKKKSLGKKKEYVGRDSGTDKRVSSPAQQRGAVVFTAGSKRPEEKCLPSLDGKRRQVRERSQRHTKKN
ncbi:unnamed protein product [Linum trigynum]|uniref:Uncharacterized protein n=1 Tax=Linum trigynum TaxID=586398 RepID=A0AAV2GHI7_9ROSI